MHGPARQARLCQNGLGRCSQRERKTDGSPVKLAGVGMLGGSAQGTRYAQICRHQMSSLVPLPLALAGFSANAKKCDSTRNVGVILLMLDRSAPALLHLGGSWRRQAARCPAAKTGTNTRPPNE